MALQMFFFILFGVTPLLAQENFSDLEASAIAKDNFPVRLTKEEQQAKMQATKSASVPKGDSSSADYCKRPSGNCPPLTPQYDPCDCITDYYPSLIFKGVDLNIEYLFWTVEQEATNFVLTPNGIHQPYPPSTVSNPIGNYKSANFDWNSGVRASLGYTFEKDAWHLSGQYTFYQTSGKKNVKVGSDPTLYIEPAVWQIVSSTTASTGIQTHTNLHYQVADLLISRRFLPGTQILFNLFTGATGAWIDEKWNTVGVDANSTPSPITTTTQNNWRFSGGGIRTGLDTNWHLGAGFGIFNRFSIATLIGPYHNHNTITIDPPSALYGPNTSEILNDAKEDETWIVPHSQLEFGLNWNHRFACWSMALQAAFEVNTWYDLHEVHEITGFFTANHDKIDIVNASDVKLWGLTLTADFNF